MGGGEFQTAGEGGKVHLGRVPHAVLSFISIFEILLLRIITVYLFACARYMRSIKKAMHSWAWTLIRKFDKLSATP